MYVSLFWYSKIVKNMDTRLNIVNALKRNLHKTDSLNKWKTLSKNGSPVTFLIEKTDDDYSLFFFINRIKDKVIINFHKTNAPACQYWTVCRMKLLWQVG